ncbi:MAG: hypothetical protein KF774_00045 [Planctomyces sp.]|nr:hypothetical protein [Planctomyces sp.]
MSGIVGWDIGGANIKASDGEQRSIQVEFALWDHPDELAGLLRRLSDKHFPQATRWALTMTGELADCFTTKRDGVQRLVAAAESASAGRTLDVWTTAGEFVSPDDARDEPILVAAANWHALATWCGRVAPVGHALLVDVGSTTTDIVPLKEGFPDPEGRTDSERLISGELVYTGARRTPVNTLANAVTFRRRNCPLAAETFATTLDVHLLLGEISEDPADRSTANGRPATRDAALDRLARMICCDREECELEDALEIAGELATAQKLRIAASIARVIRRFPEPPETVVVSGSGEFLARAALDESGESVRRARRLSLAETLGPQHSSAACAYALARLAQERP